MAKNTCSIQAQIKNIMIETLDALVYVFTVYIKGEKRLICHNHNSSITLTYYPIFTFWTLLGFIVPLSVRFYSQE